MAEHVIHRSGEVDLMFEGELLADLSSRQERRPRWQEVRIYRTATGKWVTELVGRSIVGGERDRVRVTVCDTATEVRDSLRRRAENGYLTDLALDALATAATADGELLDATQERV